MINTVHTNFNPWSGEPGSVKAASTQAKTVKMSRTIMKADYIGSGELNRKLDVKCLEKMVQGEL